MSQHINHQPGIDHVRAARLAMGVSAETPFSTAHSHPVRRRAAHGVNDDRSFAYADTTIEYPSKTGMRERDAQRDSFLRGGSQFTSFQSQRIRQRPPSLAQRFVGSLKRTLSRKRETPVFFNFHHARSGKVTDAHFYDPSVLSMQDTTVPDLTAPIVPPAHKTESVYSQFTEHMGPTTAPPSTHASFVSGVAESFVPHSQHSPLFSDMQVSVSSYVRPQRAASNSSGFGFRAASRRTSASTTTTRQPHLMRKPVVVLTTSEQLAERRTDRMHDMQDAAAAIDRQNQTNVTDEPSVPVQHPNQDIGKPDGESGSQVSQNKDAPARRPHPWDLKDMLRYRRDRTTSENTNQVLNYWSDSSERQDDAPTSDAPIVPDAPVAPAAPAANYSPVSPATLATPALPAKIDTKQQTSRKTKSPKSRKDAKSPKGQKTSSPTNQAADGDRHIFGEILNSARQPTQTPRKSWIRPGGGRLTPKTAAQRQFSHDMRQSRTPNGKQVSSAIKNYEEKVTRESFESRQASPALGSFRGTVKRTMPTDYNLEDAVRSHFGPVDAWQATMHDVRHVHTSDEQC